MPVSAKTTAAVYASQRQVVNCLIVLYNNIRRYEGVLNCKRAISVPNRIDAKM